jgi:DNA-binding transcriptional ArsR family regulator
LNQNVSEMNNKKAVEIFKALSNQTRVSMLQMLKDPEAFHGTQAHVCKEEGFEGGVCVSDIVKKTGTSQSTTSQYLSILQKSGLVETKRIGQWTYYRRNEEMIKWFEQYIGSHL